MKVVHSRKILGDDFWKLRCLPVFGFFKTYIMLVTNTKDYVTLDPNDVDADFRFTYRDTMIAQFKRGL